MLIIGNKIFIFGFAAKTRCVGHFHPVETETLEGLSDLRRNIIGKDEPSPDMPAHFGQFKRINGLSLIVPFHLGIRRVQIDDGILAVPFFNDGLVILVVDLDTPEFVLEIIHMLDQIRSLFQWLWRIRIAQPTEGIIGQVKVPEKAFLWVGRMRSFQSVEQFLVACKIILTDFFRTDVLEVFPDVVDILVLVIQNIAHMLPLWDLQENLPRPQKRLNIGVILFREHVCDLLSQTEFAPHAAKDCQSSWHFFKPIPLFFYC